MRASIISSSLDASSRSERLARAYAAELSSSGVEAEFLSLKDFNLPRFDNGPATLTHPSYKALHQAVAKADGLVLASPIYNWACCAELKQFIEIVGTTPPDGSARSPFFDKIVSFVNAAGIPQSYMAFSSVALSMMLDFKCIINPYTVYVDNTSWSGDTLCDQSVSRLQKSALVMVDLMRCLTERKYHSEWDI